MKKLAIFGIVALLFATVGFGDARDGMWPSSAIVFPYWDSLNGFTTHFRITNISTTTPNAFVGPETLAMHLWYMNRICQEQNFIIPFTQNDTEWIRVWQQADYDRVWDPFLGTFVGSDQGFAVGYAITQSPAFGNWLIPWNFFVADAIIQNVGLGWAFAYEALGAEYDPIAPGIQADPATAPLEPVLDTDPPSLRPPFWVPAFGGGNAVFGFFPGSLHYLPLCTPSMFFPHYINAAMSGWRFYDTQYVILPWDGIFDAATQFQNCYFFNSVTYDAQEVPISNSTTLIRCWSVCDIDQITQGAARRSVDGFGWSLFTPNPGAVDFPFNNRICNTTVPALNNNCRLNLILGVVRPYINPYAFAGVAVAPYAPFLPAVVLPLNTMGAFILQYEPQRVTATNHLGWGFYSPRLRVPGPRTWPTAWLFPIPPPWVAVPQAACPW